MPIKVTKKVANAKSAGPRILVYDIETTPMKAYVWGCFKQFIHPSQIISTTEVLSFAAKWLGEQTVFFDSTMNDENDERLCKVAWDLIDRADIVVGHNGIGFDETTMNARWAKWKLPEPSPYKSIDTYRIAKKRFRFPRNQLDAIARYLDIGKKLEHEGFDLWKKCMAGDRKAWAKMQEYNIKDVLLTENVYMRLRTWDKNHPNIGLMTKDDKPRCVCCGYSGLTKLDKPTYTGVSAFPSFRCNKCKKIMRGRKRHKQSWGEDNPTTNAQ